MKGHGIDKELRNFAITDVSRRQGRGDGVALRVTGGVISLDSAELVADVKRSLARQRTGSRRTSGGRDGEL